MSKVSPRATSRTELIAAIQRLVFPALEQSGFQKMQNDEPGSMLIYFWHRPASVGGYHLLDLVFDAKRNPAFYGMIQTVGEEGLILPSGKHVEPARTHANHHLKRVFVQRRNQNVIGRILPTWFRHTFFTIPSTGDKNTAKLLAEQVCAEFLHCLPQAEEWFRDRSLGPNLFEAEVVIGSPGAT